MQTGTITSLVLSLTLAANVAAQGQAAGTLGQGAATQAKSLQQIHIATGALKGRILATGTRTPVADHSLQLFDSKGMSLGKISTDAAGMYATPELPVGNYTLEVQSGMRLGLTVDKLATIKTLDIVVPPAAAAAPAPSAESAPNPPASSATTSASNAPVGQSVAGAAGGGLSGGTIALLGAGVAVAVAVPIGLESHGATSENPVSPSGEKAKR